MKLTGLSLIALAVAGMFLIGFANGCSYDEIVQVDVPKDVQKSMDTSPKVSLKEARLLIEEYDETHNRSRKRFAEEIADGAFLEQILISTTNDGIDMAVPAVGNLPGGAILVGLLGSLGGVITGRQFPSKKRLDEEWETGKDDALKIKNT